MARARLLKPGFFANGELAALPPHARLLFAGLWTLVDREGRMKDDVLFIKGQLFPHEEVDVDDLLTKLAQSKFVVRYGARTNKYLAVTKFRAHQTPHIREPESQIPEPPKKHGASTMPASDKPRASTGKAGPSPAVAVAVTDPVAVAVTGAPGRETVDGKNVFVIFDDYLGGGKITQTLRDILDAAEERYGLECIAHCCVEATKSSPTSRNWNFVESICQRHEREGCNAERRDRNNGAYSAGGPAAADSSPQYQPITTNLD